MLIGWHQVSRRDNDFRDACEPVELMAQAAEGTGLAAAALRLVDWIGVTEGLTRYPDPGRLVADRIGATGAHTVLAKIGVMQHSLIARACQAVQSGEATVALVVGGEAHYRHVRAGGAGHSAPVTEQPDGTTPGETLSSAEFDDNMSHPAEAAAGLAATPGYYSLIDSHWRAEHRRSPDEHRDAVAALYERFVQIAATNPHAVRTHPYSRGEIRDASPSNPMIAFPYTKLMITTWTVDQGCALVFATAATADAMGIPRSRWCFPVIAAESNHVVPVAARTRLHQPAAMRIIADAVRRHTGLEPAGADLFDLYSAFPVPALVGAEGLGISADRDLTVTGGMSFAGGPLNSYVFHAIATAAQELSDSHARSALISCVSGFYTKQAALVLSSDPPAKPFVVVDVSADVAKAEPRVPMAGNSTGDGTVVAYTVLFEDGHPERCVAVIDLLDGRRTVARNHDEQVMATAMETDLVGGPVSVAEGLFTPAPIVGSCAPVVGS